MKNKVTQVDAIKILLLTKEKVNGSNAYAYTKKYSGVGTLNLHKIIAALRGKGMKIKEEWKVNSTSKSNYKQFYI